MKEVPGIYAKSIEIGTDVLEDTFNGFFKNVNSQIDMVCANLTADANLKDGFNVIGFSQGGQFWYDGVSFLYTGNILRCVRLCTLPLEIFVCSQ